MCQQHGAQHQANLDLQGSLEEGDCVRAVNGSNVEGMTPESVARLIAGPDGSEVTLDIERLVILDKYSGIPHSNTIIGIRRPANTSIDAADPLLLSSRSAQHVGSYL